MEYMTIEEMLATLKLIVLHNETELEKVDWDQGNAENLITFEHDGIEIFDPFKTEDLRSEVFPFLHYDVAQIREMIKSWSDYKMSETIKKKLQKQLGERYREWHYKEVMMLINKGTTTQDQAIKSFIKRLNK